MATKRFGKHPPQHDYRTLRFKAYAAALPPPPSSFDALERVYSSLHVTSAGDLFPIDGNDTIGDCTVAAMAHAITESNGFLGKRKVPPAAAARKLYVSLTGGPDTGLNELDVLTHWRQHKDLGETLLAYVKIDPKDTVRVKQAIKIFGGVYLGFQVQKDCIEDFDAHKPRTPAPLTNDGHAVFAVGYDESDVTVLTWGNTQKGTWAWWNECVDEAYVLLTPEAAEDGFAPGFDFEQLKADLASVAS